MMPATEGQSRKITALAMEGTIIQQSEKQSPPSLRRRRVPVDRVHSTLLRRIDGCAERRTEAALENVTDFSVWKRERDRGDKLRRVLITWLINRFQSENPMPVPNIPLTHSPDRPT